jgi:hypothetical protein
METKFRPWSHLRFYGDSELRLDDPVIWFPDEHVICDYTECGLYIAGKHVSAGYKPVEIILKDIFDKYELYTPVHAEGNRIAQQFREYKIEILWDLLLHLLVHG